MNNTQSLLVNVDTSGLQKWWVLKYITLWQDPLIPHSKRWHAIILSTDIIGKEKNTSDHWVQIIWWLAAFSWTYRPVLNTHFYFMTTQELIYHHASKRSKSSPGKGTDQVNNCLNLEALKFFLTFNAADITRCCSVFQMADIRLPNDNIQTKQWQGVHCVKQNFVEWEHFKQFFYMSVCWTGKCDKS